MLIVILHYWVYQVNKSYPFNWLHVSYTLSRHLSVYLKMLHVSYTSVKLGSQKRKKIAVNVGKMCVERQIENVVTVFQSGNLDADKVSFSTPSSSASLETCVDQQNVEEEMFWTFWSMRPERTWSYCSCSFWMLPWDCHVKKTWFNLLEFWHTEQNQGVPAGFILIAGHVSKDIWIFLTRWPLKLNAP